MKLLFIDIETSPNLAYVWGKWQQNVLSYEREWDIISYSAKWLQGKQETKVLPDYPNYVKDQTYDKELVQDIWNLFNKADVVCAHNAKGFDVKKINTKFLQHRLTPPEPYEIIDTLQLARKYFKFNCNKLDSLAKSLGLGAKLTHTGFDLWLKCMKGDSKSWKKMKAYNKQDVILLEQVYLKLLPWIDNHPNVAVFQDIPDGCRNCGSSRLVRQGKKITNTGKAWRYVCKDCGAWSRGMHYKTTNIR